MRVGLAAAALTNLAALLLFPPAEARCRAVSAEWRTEASQVRDAVAATFAHDPRFASRVKVTVGARGCGVVTLSGVVPTSADIREAGRLASTVPGVSVIYNLLVIPHHLASAASRDATRNSAREPEPRELLAGAR